MALARAMSELTRSEDLDLELSDLAFDFFVVARECRFELRQCHALARLTALGQQFLRHLRRIHEVGDDAIEREQDRPGYAGRRVQSITVRDLETRKSLLGHR